MAPLTEPLVSIGPAFRRVLTRRYLGYRFGTDVRPRGQTLTSADKITGPFAQRRAFDATENQVDLFRGRNRRHMAVLVRTDGRRVQMPVEDLGLVDFSLSGVARFIEIGIERVLALITGGRRETGPRNRA
jgi:hypothetical protein